MNHCIEKIIVKYSEMDQNFALKPYSLLNFLQDIASKSAEELGFGYSFISKRNLAWFLIKYRMEFVDYPVNIMDLTLKTTPRGFNRLFAYRDFELFNNEKLIGKVFSVWSIVDIESRTPMLVSNVFAENGLMKPYEKSEDDLSFVKIKPISNPQFKKEFQVRYNDLDVNQHANNGNYIVWAFEPLEFEFKANRKIKTLDVVFKKESKFGDKIISEVEFLDDKTTVHRLRNSNDEDLCFFQVEWV